MKIHYIISVKPHEPQNTIMTENLIHAFLDVLSLTTNRCTRVTSAPGLSRAKGTIGNS